MVQIADTEHDRVGFSDVDYSFHRYPMQKLFDGCYEDVPTWSMIARLTWEVLQGEVGSGRAAGLSPPGILGDDGGVHRDRQAPRGVLRFDRRATGRARC